MKNKIHEILMELNRGRITVSEANDQIISEIDSEFTDQHDRYVDRVEELEAENKKLQCCGNCNNAWYGEENHAVPECRKCLKLSNWEPKQ